MCIVHVGRLANSCMHQYKLCLILVILEWMQWMSKSTENMHK